jgi:hypothetical protein
LFPESSIAILNTFWTSTLNLSEETDEKKMNKIEDYTSLKLEHEKASSQDCEGGGDTDSGSEGRVVRSLPSYCKGPVSIPGHGFLSPTKFNLRMHVLSSYWSSSE